MQRDGYIVLYNPISNEGHLDSWHLIFADLLRRKGWPVILVTTALAQMRTQCIQRGLALNSDFILLGVEPSCKGPRAYMRRLLQRVDLYFDKYLLGNVAKYVGIQHLRRYFSGLRTGVKKAVSSGRIVTHINPSVFRDHVNPVLQARPGQVRAVFNMYVDAYDLDPTEWVDFSLVHNTPWMGLCITPSDLPSQAYYADSSYRGTCFLDERVFRRYAELRPDKNFAYLPDITETGLPKEMSQLAQDILKRANGRNIVFLGGSIGQQKNLARWFDLVSLADPSDWFFLQVGRLNKNNLFPEDEAALEKIQLNRPQNLFIKPDFVTDERCFNELISISSVIFAVYRDFKRSSNMLSKAAYFEKPILVSDEFLMGERVQRYKIGQAVKQDDALQIHSGLSLCRQFPPTQHQYATYRQDFSETTMQTALHGFVQNCLVTKPLG